MFNYRSIKFIIKLWIILSLVAGICGLDKGSANLFCYYDSGSSLRAGLGKLSSSDLEFALPYCSHLVYGYLGIKPDLYEVYSLHEDLDIHSHQFSNITALKRKFPHLKVLVSIGGDKDIDPDHANKYIQLLEAGSLKQTAFINSAKSLVRAYGFDGIDLAYQFPKNKPRKVHCKPGTCWKKIKKAYTGDFIVDPIADVHKKQFTSLVRDLRNAFNTDDLLLSLTVLPNVNSTWYFDVPVLSSLVDYVNLAAFDFVTPERNPEEADYSAPLFRPKLQNRLPHYNANYQVAYWLYHQCPAHKIILGMATYGRAWKLSVGSGSTGLPVVPRTEGAAAAGPQSQSAGLLSWPEICEKFPNPSYAYHSNFPIASDPIKLVGPYAYRPADENGYNGIWISYEDLNSAINKASYVRAFELGGLSIFDLSYDDFSGFCTGERYPLLKAAEYYLSLF